MIDQNQQNNQTPNFTSPEVTPTTNYKPYVYTAILAIIAVAGLGYYLMPEKYTYQPSSVLEDVSNASNTPTTTQPVTPQNPNPAITPTPGLVACTMDAMMCPDGSYVGRSGPNCEFVCPIPTAQDKGIVISLKVDDASNNAYKLPITINGYVSDNSKWRVFEGEAGIVYVYAIIDGQEKQIASEPIILKDFNEGVSSSFYFDMMIGDRQWMSNISNKDGYILIKEAGAKDGDVIDSIKIPIIFDIASN